MMKNGIVIYKSKYGASEKYAGWISESVGFELSPVSKIKTEDLSEYETVILCGGIYASGISGLSFLRKNFGRLKEKRLAVFCVGASPYNEKSFDEIKKHNMKDMLSEVPVFYGRGAWNEEAMTFTDRTLCKMLQKAVAKKDPASYEPWEEALMSAVGGKCDWTDIKYTESLIDFIKRKE